MCVCVGLMWHFGNILLFTFINMCALAPHTQANILFLANMISFGDAVVAGGMSKLARVFIPNMYLKMLSLFSVLFKTKHIETIYRFLSYIMRKFSRNMEYACFSFGWNQGVSKNSEPIKWVYVLVYWLDLFLTHFEKCFCLFLSQFGTFTSEPILFLFLCCFRCHLIRNKPK